MFTKVKEYIPLKPYVCVQNGISQADFPFIILKTTLCVSRDLTQ
jgi:hypothetical protein